MNRRLRAIVCSAWAQWSDYRLVHSQPRTFAFRGWVSHRASELLQLTNLIFLLFFLTRISPMSSSQDSDFMEAQDGKSVGFVKSVIKALSGTRFRSPEGSKGASPTFEQLESAQIALREHYSDEVVNRRSPAVESSVERGCDDEFRPPPIKEPGNEIRYMDVPSNILAGLEKNQNLLPTFQSREESAASFHGGSPDRGERSGKGFCFPPSPESSPFASRRERDVMFPDRQPSHAFPSFLPLSTTGAYRTVQEPEPDCHPYFYHPPSAPVGLVNSVVDESVSLRVGTHSIQNVTQRDAKRPKERSRDKAYKQRFSMVSSGDMAEHRPSFAFQTGPDNIQARIDNGATPAPSGTFPIPAPNQPRAQSAFRGHSPGNGSFEIVLIYSGARVVHRVWDSMPISQLISAAGMIFGLDQSEITLVLFSMSPISLHRDARILGPPRVTAGATVMVFHLPGARLIAPPQGRSVDPPPPALSSKLLASFKLPKFDGVARSWKLWEKSFTRFLGIHQLDHVLEEGFLDTMWTVPGATAANKMVYFLVEDAVAPKTLASSLIRQATRWNGHEAFVLLRNGYVFNGPQTATILLAELSKIRLKRDEDASSFCLRLVELIEDLELIPGNAAVYLTDTQKLGYLLSAIRHESSLQAVYSQLQSEQLRGTVTFDQACRELHHRVESMRADDYLDGHSGRALISTTGKKKGQGSVELVKLSCLAKDCAELVQPYLPLCKLCYLQCMAGKVSSLPLRDNLGNAVFNPRTKVLDFPPAVPPSRFPKKGMKKGKKVMLVCQEHVTADSSSTVN